MHSALEVGFVFINLFVSCLYRSTLYALYDHDCIKDRDLRRKLNVNSARSKGLDSVWLL